MTDERPDPLKTAATTRAHDEAMTAAVKLNQDARVMLADFLDSIEEGETVDFNEVHEWWRLLTDSCATLVLTHRNNASPVADMLTDYAATQERLAVVEEAAKDVLGHISYTLGELGALSSGDYCADCDVSEGGDGKCAPWQRQLCDLDGMLTSADAALRTTLEDGRDGP